MLPVDNFITHLFNIDEKDVSNFKIFVDDDTTVFDITLVRKPLRCPYCDYLMIGHGHTLKFINHPVLTSKRAIIKYHRNRYFCKACNCTAMETDPFTFDNRKESYLLIQRVMDKLKDLDLSLRTISNDLSISRTQINTYLDSYITIPNFPLPESIGIDELYSKSLSRKNSAYICIITDNQHRYVYDVLDSRSKARLSDYFFNIPLKQRENVKYVTIDMWKPYKEVAQTFFPNCKIAVDPFHVIEHLTKDFDRLRIDLMNKCSKDSTGYYLLKNWKWLLHKSESELNNSPHYNGHFKRYMNYKDIITTIFRTFPILHTAYWLKEEYRRFNRVCSYDQAVLIYDKIVNKFRAAEIQQYDEFINILVEWKTEILNSLIVYNGRKLSNAFTEQSNRKIRQYLTLSRGMHNFARFRKRVIYALNPNIEFVITNELKSEKVKGRSRGTYNKTPLTTNLDDKN